MFIRINSFHGTNWFATVFILIAVCIFGGASLAKAEVSCGDTITQNTKLGSDLLDCSGNGIVIGADNITLDCDGHTVSGVGTDGGTIGIVVFGRTGVFVKNCTVEMFDNGNWLHFGSGNHKLFSNMVRQNGSGINIGDPDNILFWNILTDNNATGVLFFDVPGNLPSWNTADGNSTGFQVSGTRNKLVENTARGNILTGFALVAASENSLIMNKAQENNEGFVLVQNSNDNFLTKNKASGNSVNCINEDTGTGNIFTKNNFGGTNNCPGP